MDPRTNVVAHLVQFPGKAGNVGNAPSRLGFVFELQSYLSTSTDVFKIVKRASIIHVISVPTARRSCVISLTTIYFMLSLEARRRRPRTRL